MIEDINNEYDELDDEQQLYEHWKIEVDAGQTPVRIDKFLAEKNPYQSRNRIQAAADAGCIHVNGSPVKSNYKVRPNDVITLMLDRPKHDTSIVAEDIPLNVVYEDDDLMVVNKEAGMVVHPGAGNFTGTLINAVAYHLKDLESFDANDPEVGLVHRIDKDTSGLLVVAKNDNAHHNLSEQFAEHSIERTYFAIVYGVLNPLSGTIEGNIARSNFDRKKMAIVASGGKSAVTHYKTLQIFGKTASLVQCNLETGRTHQIRVHLSSKGNNLIGDKVYEKAKKTMIAAPAEIKSYINNFPRQALHAASLGFLHPRTREFLHFEASLPDDMTELLKILQQIQP